MTIFYFIFVHKVRSSCSAKAPHFFSEKYINTLNFMCTRGLSLINYFSEVTVL